MHPSLSPEIQGGEQRSQGMQLGTEQGHRNEVFGTVTDLSTGEGEGWLTWH